MAATTFLCFWGTHHSKKCLSKDVVGLSLDICIFDMSTGEIYERLMSFAGNVLSLCYYKILCDITPPALFFSNEDVFFIHLSLRNWWTNEGKISTIAIKRCLTRKERVSCNRFSRKVTLYCQQVLNMLISRHKR